MPLTYRVDRERRRAIAAASGVVSAQEFLDQQTAVASDPDFQSDFDAMYDLRQMESFEGASQDVKALALSSPFAEGSRRAVVAASNVIFGLARMYQALSEESAAEIQVFRKMESAEAWLEESR